MKRASKPPTPPHPSAQDEGARLSRNRAQKVGAGAFEARRPPPPGRAPLSPFAVPPTFPRPTEIEPSEAVTEDELEADDIETNRPPAPTIPFVPTPAVEWEPAPPRAAYRPPSSNDMPAAPKRPPSDRSMEAALREQMWSGLQATPTQTAQTGPHLPVQMQRGHALAPPERGHALVPPPPPSSSSVLSSPGSAVSGMYPTSSEPRDVAVPRPGRPPRQDEGMPLGYVVASAFFLAIALVGFGLWLAFEVISL